MCASTSLWLDIRRYREGFRNEQLGVEDYRSRLETEVARVLARAGWDGRDADEWDQAPIPVIRSAPETMWIWSDLHLGDPSVIGVFGRPFTEVGAMNAFLLAEWRDRVQAGRKIICLGDVLHENVWWRELLVACGLDVSPAECSFKPVAARRRQQWRVRLRVPMWVHDRK